MDGNRIIAVLLIGFAFFGPLASKRPQAEKESPVPSAGLQAKVAVISDHLQGSEHRLAIGHLFRRFAVKLRADSQGKKLLANSHVVDDVLTNSLIVVLQGEAVTSSERQATAAIAEFVRQHTGSDRGGGLRAVPTDYPKLIEASEAIAWACLKE